MHDPFQTYQALGACSLGANPYATGQGFYPGIPQQIPGLNPYAAGAQSPLFQTPFAQHGLQNPLLQNPLLQNPLLQNPLLQQALIHQHLLAQQSAWQNPLLHGIPQQQFGSPLQPQTMIGANPYAGQFGGPFGGQFGGQGYGQLHPIALQQLALRSLATSGLTPWAGI
jgi:hypothetical protein